MLGTSWKVRWPDGTVCVHNTGADGRFELAHFQLHISAGAPLSRAHIDGLLLGQDVGTLPVVRSPLWTKPSTDDEVPGSLGVALLQAGQTVIQVIWGCSTSPRDIAPMYVPDNKGVYPLCHGIVPGQEVNVFTAKEGVPVEDVYGQKGALIRPVEVVFPVSAGEGKMATRALSIVWRVAWEGGATTECKLGDRAAFVAEDKLLVSNGLNPAVGGG